MDEKTNKTLTPPYISWRTFYTYLQSLRQTMPNRVDTSGMPTMSGSNRTLVMATLKYFKLIDGDGHPTPELKALATATVPDAKAEYQRLLREMLEKHYPLLFEDGFDLKGATPLHFSEKFKKMNMAGDTARKAETFFLEASKDAGIPISPLISSSRKKGRKVGSPGAGRKQNQQRQQTPPLAGSGYTGGFEQPTGYWFDKLKVFIDELPPSDARYWTESERDAWIQGITTFLNMLVKIRDEENG